MSVNDYTTLAEVKAYMPHNDVTTTTDWDALIAVLITNVSRQIDRFVGRKPGSFYITSETTRYFDGPSQGTYSPVYGFKTQRLTSGYTGAISLYVDEMCVFPSSVAVAESGQIDTGPSNTGGNYTVWPQSDYYAEPANFSDIGTPFNKLTLDIIYGTHRVWYPYHKGIKVTGSFGYSTTVPADVKEATMLSIVRLIRKAQQNYQTQIPILDTIQPSIPDALEKDIINMIMHYRRIAI